MTPKEIGTAKDNYKQTKVIAIVLSAIMLVCSLGILELAMPNAKADTVPGTLTDVCQVSHRTAPEGIVYDVRMPDGQHKTGLFPADPSAKIPDGDHGFFAVRGENGKYTVSVAQEGDEQGEDALSALAPFDWLPVGNASFTVSPPPSNIPSEAAGNMKGIAYRISSMHVTNEAGAPLVYDIVSDEKGRAVITSMPYDEYTVEQTLGNSAYADHTPNSDIILASPSVELTLYAAPK